jgi:hypothetical protein
MPVIDGEVCYEGILEQSRQEVQRFMFWACVLSGAAGHTYGANGIWQVNTAGQPFGLSPHGRSWGDTPWDVASELPGSRQLGWAKALLMRYPWWRLEPHPEWVEPHWTTANYVQPYCGGIPRELRIVFMPPMWDAPKIVRLETGLSYRASYFNPATEQEHPAGTALADAAGVWQPPVAPVFSGLGAGSRPLSFLVQSRYNRGMATQNYSNHTRYVFGFHVVLAGILFLTLIGSLVNLYNSWGIHGQFYSAALIVVLTVCGGMLFYYTRTFACKAQDRAIRAEENLRHFVLTGKLLDARLAIRQIIALRFAPDNEFVDLARKAADGNMPAADIKRAIKNWKADDYRV